MTYLTPDKYQQFLIEAIDLNVMQIGDYFRSKYLEHKEHNPKFKNELANALVKLIEFVDSEINKFLSGIINKEEFVQDEIPIEVQTSNGVKKINKNIVAEIARGYRLFTEQIAEAEQSNKEQTTPENRIEDLPEFEYKRVTQKIAWLYELGVLQMILNLFKTETGYGVHANVIQSFTDIKTDHIRQSLTAIFNENETNKKNNPLNNANTKLFIQQMREKFKLDKEKDD